MDLTIEGRVLQLVSPGSAALGSNPAAEAHVALLRQLIPALSKQVEDYLGRQVQIANITQYFDVRHHQRVFPLKAWPVTAVTGVWFSRDQTFDDDTLLDEDLYLDATLDESGFLETVSDLITGNGAASKALKITYRGGMAVNTTDFVIRYPDIAVAVEKEVVRAWSRRNQQGVQSVSSNEGGTIVMPSGPLYEFTLETLSILKRYRRDALAA